MEYKKLVSICVVTYNAEKTILETLESIYNQNYNTIELIISDDHSNDATISVIKDWLLSHRKRFVNVKIIESPINTGVTANCNRGCKAASGDYIKAFGDDILVDTYVSDCVEWFETHEKSKILFTRVQLLDENTKEILVDDKHDYAFFNLSAKEQFESIINRLGLYIPTCSSMYRASTLKEMDFFDEEIPMWEDGPMYFRLSEKGVKFDFIDKELVKYRVCFNSLSHMGGTKLIEESGALLYLKYYYKYDKKKNYLKSRLRYIRNKLLSSKNVKIKVFVKLLRKIKHSFMGLYNDK